MCEQAPLLPEACSLEEADSSCVIGSEFPASTDDLSNMTSLFSTVRRLHQAASALGPRDMTPYMEVQCCVVQTIM